MGNNSVALASGIVKKARQKRGVTQVEFAKGLGKTQGEVSKYERGIVDPPSHIIIQCMNILEGGIAEMPTPSVANIIEKLTDGFDAPNYAMARALIMGIIMNEESKARPV